MTRIAPGGSVPRRISAGQSRRGCIHPTGNRGNDLRTPLEALRCPLSPSPPASPPVVHAWLTEMAQRRGTSLAATAADVLSAAVADGDEVSRGQPDGALVAAVHALLDDLTAPKAVVLRELSVRLARTVERGERGAVAAADLLTSSMEKALQAQRHEDNPGGDTLDLLLGGMSGFGL